MNIEQLLLLKGDMIMNNWKCPIENLDEDIREVVRLLFNNNMKPYMSCSGSYKDHKEKQYIPESACVEMLDSEATRELMAMLIKDKRFKCSIAKERERVIYDNDLPNGLRFMIEFENICGEMQKELMAIIQSISHGKKTDIKEREKIDVVCNLIDTFDVIDDSQIMFSFNDEMMLEGKEDEDNYSIEIRDRTDFEDYFTLIDHAIEGYEQDENRTKFYGNDFLNLSSTLRKIISD